MKIEEGQLILVVDKFVGDLCFKILNFDGFSIGNACNCVEELIKTILLGNNILKQVEGTIVLNADLDLFGCIVKDLFQGGEYESLKMIYNKYMLAKEGTQIVLIFEFLSFEGQEQG